MFSPEKVLAAFVTAACVVAFIRLCLGAQRRRRFDQQDAAIGLGAARGKRDQAARKAAADNREIARNTRHGARL